MRQSKADATAAAWAPVRLDGLEAVIGVQRDVPGPGRSLGGSPIVLWNRLWKTMTRLMTSAVSAGMDQR